MECLTRVSKVEGWREIGRALCRFKISVHEFLEGTEVCCGGWNQ